MPSTRSNLRSVNIIPAVLQAAKEEMKRRTQARGGTCHLSELVNLALVSYLNLPDPQVPTGVVSIKKAAKARSA